jgi:hypothetical protein
MNTQGGIVNDDHEKRMIFIRAEVENKTFGGREKKLPRSGLVQQ